MEAAGVTADLGFPTEKEAFATVNSIVLDVFRLSVASVELTISFYGMGNEQNCIMLAVESELIRQENSKVEGDVV